MITYKDMTFCLRKGCGRRTCPRNLVHVDWSFGLPVSVADFWGKRSECPVLEPLKMNAFKKMDGGAEK